MGPRWRNWDPRHAAACLGMAPDPDEGAGLSQRARDDDEVLRMLAAEGLVSLGSGKLEDFEPVEISPGESLAEQIVSDRR